MIENIKLGKQESGKEDSKKKTEIKAQSSDFGRNFLIVIIYNKIMIYNRRLKPIWTCGTQL